MRLLQNGLKASEEKYPKKKLKQKDGGLLYSVLRKKKLKKIMKYLKMATEMM